MGAYQRGKESQSIIDNCLFLCFSFVVLAHLSFLQVWKARHPRVFALSLNLLCGLQQDLKDLMRKAGEVTFVDAHRPNRNEGWDCFLFSFFIFTCLQTPRVSPDLLTSVLMEARVLNSGWSSLHHAATWRMPSPSLTGQNWTDASWKSLRTAESELFSFFTGHLHVLISDK